MESAETLGRVSFGLEHIDRLFELELCGTGAHLDTEEGHLMRKRQIRGEEETTRGASLLRGLVNNGRVVTLESALLSNPSPQPFHELSRELRFTIENLDMEDLWQRFMVFPTGTLFCAPGIRRPEAEGFYPYDNVKAIKEYRAIREKDPRDPVGQLADRYDNRRPFNAQEFTTRCHYIAGEF